MDEDVIKEGEMVIIRMQDDSLQGHTSMMKAFGEQKLYKSKIWVKNIIGRKEI